jgi:hypothetical protein
MAGGRIGVRGWGAAGTERGSRTKDKTRMERKECVCACVCVCVSVCWSGEKVL